MPVSSQINNMFYFFVAGGGSFTQEHENGGTDLGFVAREREETREGVAS